MTASFLGYWVTRQAVEFDIEQQRLQNKHRSLLKQIRCIANSVHYWSTLWFHFRWNKIILAIIFSSGVTMLSLSIISIKQCMRTRQFSREIQNVCWYKLLRPAQRSYLFLSWKRLRIRFDGKFVLKFESLIGSLFYQFPVPTAQHPIQQSKMAVKIFYLTILWAPRKWKSKL